jgi:DNA-binding transcriptional MerR regulator
MQIGEVAQRISLTVDAIRFYEKRKLLRKADRSAGRFRLYSQDAVAQPTEEQVSSLNNPRGAI